MNKLMIMKSLSLIVAVIFTITSTLQVAPHDSAVNAQSLRAPATANNIANSELAERIMRNYDIIAKQKRYELDKEPAMLKAANSIFEKAIPTDLVKGSRVLDIGTGRGMIAKLAAEKGAREVVGVDISANMLEDAREQLNRFKNVSFRKGDILNLSNIFPSSTRIQQKFNIITIGNVLGFYSPKDKRTILSQAIELLEEGGYLAILYRSFDESEPEPGDPPSLLNARSTTTYHTMPDEYVAMLEELGFENSGFYEASHEIDEDWGVELGDLEVIVNRNMVIWAKKSGITADKSSSAGSQTESDKEHISEVHVNRDPLDSIELSLRRPPLRGSYESELSAIELRYDGFAAKATYNLGNNEKILAAAEAIFTQVLPKDVVRSAKVLDLGIGNGLIARFAFEHGAEEVVGVDLSQGMLEWARRCLSRYTDKGKKLRTIASDILSLKDKLRTADGDVEKFDIITIGNVLTFYKAEDVKRILETAAGFLKNNGYIVILSRSFDEGSGADSFSSGRYERTLRELGFAEAGHMTGSVETDEDWGLELSELEVDVSTNYIIWGRWQESPKSSSAGSVKYFTVQDIRNRGIKLIVADFDRTLSSDPNSVSDEVVKEIERFLEGGGMFAVSTGARIGRIDDVFVKRIRPGLRKNIILLCEFSSVIGRYDSMGNLAIDNAASLQDNFFISDRFLKKVIDEFLLKLNLKVARKGEFDPLKHDIYINKKGKQSSFTIYYDNCPKAKSRAGQIQALLNDIIRDHFAKKEFNIFATPHCTDISFRSKADGLAWLIDKLNIHPEHIAVIGDTAGPLGNDRPMLMRYAEALNIYVGIEDSSALPDNILHTRTPAEAGSLEALRAINNDRLVPQSFSIEMPDILCDMFIQNKAIASAA